MNEKESKRLKVGDAVRWAGKAPEMSILDCVTGAVTEANWHAVKIVWADGPVGIIDHRDMIDVQRTEAQS